MARRKANHAIRSLHIFDMQERRFAGRRLRNIVKQCPKIIIENISILIIGVYISSAAFVAWAEITLWVITGSLVLRRSFLLTLPGAFHAMRRNEDIFAQ